MSSLSSLLSTAAIPTGGPARAGAGRAAGDQAIGTGAGGSVFADLLPPGLPRKPATVADTGRQIAAGAGDDLPSAMFLPSADAPLVIAPVIGLATGPRPVAATAGSAPSDMMADVVPTRAAPHQAMPPAVSAQATSPALKRSPAEPASAEPVSDGESPVDKAERRPSRNLATAPSSERASETVAFATDARRTIGSGTRPVPARETDGAADPRPVQDVAAGATPAIQGPSPGSATPASAAVAPTIDTRPDAENHAGVALAAEVVANADPSPVAVVPDVRPVAAPAPAIGIGKPLHAWRDPVAISPIATQASPPPADPEDRAAVLADIVVPAPTILPASSLPPVSGVAVPAARSSAPVQKRAGDPSLAAPAGAAFARPAPFASRVGRTIATDSRSGAPRAGRDRPHDDPEVAAPGQPVLQAVPVFSDAGPVPTGRASDPDASGSAIEPAAVDRLLGASGGAAVVDPSTRSVGSAVAPTGQSAPADPPLPDRVMPTPPADMRVGATPSARIEPVRPAATDGPAIVPMAAPPVLAVVDSIRFTITAPSAAIAIDPGPAATALPVPSGSPVSDSVPLTVVAVPAAPVLPEAQLASGSAGRVFAAALHAAAAPARAAASPPDGQDQDPLVAAMLAGSATVAATAPVAIPATTVDLGHPGWPARMIDQIEALRDAADATSTRVRISPDALGPVDLQVRREGDRLHVHFDSPRAETRALIADAQPQLAAAAAERGLEMGQTSVGGGGGAGQGDPPSHRPEVALPRRERTPIRPASDEVADDARIPDTRIA